MSGAISLCMIVRDEAEQLEAFLRAVAGTWDELVVVDTGSVDGTAARLEQAGARVLHLPWDEDFAAARNHGLAAATGEWILVLDADERPGLGFAEELRAIVQDPTVGAATVRMVNALPHGHARDLPLLRVFRRDPELRFRWRIHEEVATSVAAMLTRTGRRSVALQTPVQHLGYERHHMVRRQKKARDLRLLERCLADAPLDLYSHFKRLELARFWQDRALWRHAAEQACAALERTGAGPLTALHVGGELVVLIAQGLWDEPGDQLAWFDRWGALLPQSAALQLRRAECLEQVRPESAADAFARCLELTAEDGNVQLTGTRPLMGLMRVSLRAGQVAEAWEFTCAALATNDRDPEALLGALAIARTVGGSSAVAELAEALRERTGDAAELRQAMAQLEA